MNQVSSIAMFIAAALQHPNPICNGSKIRISTINVEQYKSKFDAVVVYCTLASENLVQQEWADLGNTGQPTQDFVSKCFIHDARLYRSVYVQMLRLAPQFREQILYRPDYSYLLYDDMNQFNVWLNNELELDRSSRIDYLVKMLNISSTTDKRLIADEVKQKFEKIYR